MSAGRLAWRLVFLCLAISLSSSSGNIFLQAEGGNNVASLSHKFNVQGGTSTQSQAEVNPKNNETAKKLHVESKKAAGGGHGGGSGRGGAHGSGGSSGIGSGSGSGNINHHPSSRKNAAPTMFCPLNILLFASAATFMSAGLLLSCV